MLDEATPDQVRQTSSDVIHQKPQLITTHSAMVVMFSVLSVWACVCLSLCLSTVYRITPETLEI